MSQGTPELVDVLSRIDPYKPYGPDLFEALLRLMPGLALEAVCLRLALAGIIEVYMVQRSPGDLAYPSQWHCPGSYLRQGETFEDVLKRLEEKEFQGKLHSATFVANLNPAHINAGKRGTTVSMVWLCQLEEKPSMRGKWFPVNDLPENTVVGHRTRIIPCAAGAFCAQNWQIPS